MGVHLTYTHDGGIEGCDDWKAAVPDTLMEMGRALVGNGEAITGLLLRNLNSVTILWECNKYYSRVSILY